MVEVTNHDKHLRDTLIEHWDDLLEEAIDEMLATHREAAAKAERDRLRGTLEHIIEYWNRDQNETAMADALWHIIETAEQALESQL